MSTIDEINQDIIRTEFERLRIRFEAVEDRLSRKIDHLADLLDLDRG